MNEQSDWFRTDGLPGYPGDRPAHARAYLGPAEGGSTTPDGSSQRRKSFWVLGLLALFVLVAGGIAVNVLVRGSAAPSVQMPPEAAPDLPAPAPATPSPSTSLVPATDSAVPSSPRPSALGLLDAMPVKGRAPMTGYDRSEFGPDWADADGNGCDTRNDILRRDLSQTAVDDGCFVVEGMLADPYGDNQMPFVLGVTSEDVHIDHIVALGNAWATGAQRMSPVERERFANDPLNLVAVDGELNMQKGDGDAATWLPPNKSMRCWYVTRQVEVKWAYGLWVTPAEDAAIRSVLERC